ncbi:MAG TPA: YggT family protein [Anaerolineales bacterium]|nr:YggT family protein [Anaerolineae bacterium]HIP87043.1 YggT family protein [Anaerolineales bacterium]
MAIWFLYRLVRLLFDLYTLALIARIVLPMLGMSYAHPVMRFLWSITEPLLAPIRRHLPIVGPFDFSPMVLILILWLVEQVILWVIL